jgi:hypothetical protein
MRLKSDRLLPVSDGATPMVVVDRSGGNENHDLPLFVSCR